ncbi:MAG: S-methyl-5-thioribose-1-phosphate isomerase [Hyphomicrobiaceae bacterium]|nr:MAG: S-methyl-5-thioribose-1-phosphate isomerase [Hyphomicrobiaceae bacterium]
MRLAGQATRTIWVSEGSNAVSIIDQTRLPHEVVIRNLDTAEEAAEAIRVMRVRGAPLIGAAAAYGLWLAMRQDTSDINLEASARLLAATRPTAVNLAWAIGEMLTALRQLAPGERPAAALARAGAIADDDVETCRLIGMHGLPLIKKIAARKLSGEAVNILTHCNAGWLACVDWGTATSPIYQAHEAGIAVHVWVDETRPRNQGAALTAFELGSHGVPHTLIVDNAGGHLMQRGFVDMVIVGTDRVTAGGDVANKIGTYLKALAAKDNGVPFYVACPHSTIDWSLEDGFAIPIEQRGEAEVLSVAGKTASGTIDWVAIAPAATRARNDAFDVTPARLVTGIITERGLAEASPEGLRGLYPERSATLPCNAHGTDTIKGVR